MGASAGFGTINIDWVAEGAAGSDGILMPHVEGADSLQEQPLEASADAFEEAWWRDGFAHDTQEVWFAASRTPRSQPPKSMSGWGHRVGVVYTHRMTGARGVIVGWDERTRAPRQWLNANIPGEPSWTDRIRRLYAPHYSVLEERRGPDGGIQFMQRYIVAQCREDDPEPCLQVDWPQTPLEEGHPDLHKYFESFEPDQGYTLQPWLRDLYPKG